jgi:hypothetical protein
VGEQETLFADKPSICHFPFIWFSASPPIGSCGPDAADMPVARSGGAEAVPTVGTCL